MQLTPSPLTIILLEQGLELMREAGEPMECGIFDFYKVFSRAFGEGEDGVGDIVNYHGLKSLWHQVDAQDYESLPV